MCALCPLCLPVVREGDAGERQVEDDLSQPLSGHLEGMPNGLALDDDGKVGDSHITKAYWETPAIQLAFACRIGMLTV